ncbi:MAG: DUF2851 family protein [Bacteroidetes bacterium]|nr:DUF2851 family protein [Bacteroidota bacterium]
MTEEFLHYIWETKQFLHEDLCTSSGGLLSVIHPGAHNFYSGPDFFNAQLKINEQLWAGNVEIHIRSSDWNRHAHTHDPAYDNVILHVVYEHDAEVKKCNGDEMPTLVLNGRIPDQLVASYFSMRNSKEKIACGRAGKDTALRIARETMLSRALIDRLARKTDEMKFLLAQLNGDWEEFFYRLVLHSFGMKVNADPMRQLGNIIPHRLLLKYRDAIFRMEALLFGASGLLTVEEDEYAGKLQKEFSFLQKVHGLGSMEKHAWKFMRLRPNNFPTLRIAQAAAFFGKHEKPFRSCIETNDPEMLRKVFDVKASGYWNDHYRFGVKSRTYEKCTGKNSAEILLINVIVPLKFLYGKSKKEEKYSEEAISLLEKITAEKNSVVEKYRKEEWEINSAADSQSVLELKRNYCDRKKCLDCEVGRKMLYS